MDFTHHTLHKGLPVAVKAGFDPVLHRFWMIVEPEDDDNPNADEESSLIYSNLDDQKIPKGSTEVSPDYYKLKLRELEIAVPADFFAKVAAAND